MVVRTARSLRSFVLAGAVAIAAAPAQNPYPDQESDYYGSRSGTAFDQRVPLGKQIVSVEVRHGSLINNLRFAYQNRDRTGPIVWASWLGSRMDGGSVDRFDIDPGDYIDGAWVGIRDDGGEAVAYLKLYTCRGTTAEFGSHPGRSSRMSLYGELVGFEGYADSLVSGFAVISREEHTEASGLSSTAFLALQGFRWQAVPSPMPEGRITRVRARVLADGKVAGLNIDYYYDLADRTEATGWIGTSSGGSVQSFVLDDDDYLEQIRFSIGTINGINRVEALLLGTKNGEEHVFGTAAGAWQDFAEPAPASGEIFALYGHTIAGDYLHTLGVVHRTFQGRMDEIGEPCTGGPSLSVTGAATVAVDPNVLTFAVDSSPFAARALFLGPEQPITIDGCTLWVDVGTAFVFPFDDTNRARVTIPLMRSLSGQLLYAQAVEIVQGGPILGVATASRAIAVRIGTDYCVSQN